jgi:CRISPR-associated protein (TIGR03986 family)
MITAPYNFVPLNEKVFYPLWAEKISHDIPFSDGESGEIEITITAKSPIFIRNHSKDKDNPSPEFCHHKMPDGSKQYYIPGSSIKGMVRSVMEILSFAKMEFVDDKKLSVRDMTNRNELVGQANGIGFLKFNSDGSGTFIDYSVKDGYRSAIRTIKYDQIGMSEKLRKQTFKEKYDEFGVYKKIKVKALPRPIGRRFIAKQDDNGEEAFIFFNSYITGRDGGKKYEFVLCESDKNINPIQIDKIIIDKFKSVYFDDEDSKIGQFWKKQLKTENAKKYGIPVFVKKSNNGNIQAIGLTQLFKLAYNKSIHQAIKQDKKDDLDLPETIFGTVKDDFALKGRVHFSHLASTHVTFEKDKEEVLGTPNASYYPNYIEQTDVYGAKVNHYTTLMDKDATIRGYKRYPLHQSIKESQKTNDNEKVRTKFKPLDKDTKFKGKIRFHNLKKAEIGALLSALTFHGNSDKYHHNLGMAKPLGYGKIEIELSLKNLKHTQEEYLSEFENTITKEIPNWKNSEQLQELFAMATTNQKNNNKLIYQQLKNNEGRNEFVEAKKRREHLVPYSQYGL